MLKVLTCISQNHDLRLVAAAGVVCVLASALAFRLYRKGLDRRDGHALGWFAFSGLAAGFGIWATHFIAMLAFEPALNTRYHPEATLLSLLAAVVAAGCGFALAARIEGRKSALLSGAVLGLGIVVMHFIGMAGFRTPGLLVWDHGYAAASIGIGIIFAIAAQFAAGRRPGLWRGGAGVALLAVAICGMHFTAMAAVSILPDSLVQDPLALAERTHLAIAITVIALLVMGGALAISAMEANQRGAIAKLRMATDAMPAALAFYDASDRLVVWNERYERLVPGGARVLRQGLSFDELSALYDVDESVMAAERGRRREGASSVYEFGEGRWIRIENLLTADGGIVTAGIDITSLKRDQDALSAALRTAEAGSRAKSEFLSNMSHEIRTPLNGVAGVADILARTLLDSRQAELVAVIQRSARQVDILLGDILDLSSPEAELTTAGCLPFQLASAIRAAADLHRASADDKGISFHVQLPDAMEASFEGDTDRFSRVLNALIGNAVKFTDHGRVSVEGEALDDGRFIVRVSDTGPGLDMANKARLFEPFTQMDGSSTRKHGGAGVGLALALRNARLMGAELDCDSTPGSGSVFSLDIRFVPSAVSSVASEPQTSAIAPLTILIVDDNPTNRRILELILDQIGAAHVSVEDGQQAVHTCVSSPFDAILMDIQMPVMDGLSATREIRRREAEVGGRQTPIIIVSANCQADQILAGQQAGAQKHLSKPISAGALVEALTQVLDQQAQRAA